MKRRIVESFLSLSIVQGASHLLHLLIVPFLVRVLGPENFGLISFSQAFVNYFILLTDYGFNLSATRISSTLRDDREKLSLLFCSVMVAKGGLLLLSAGVLLLLIVTVPFFQSEWRLHLVVFGSVAGHVLFPQWYFQGIEKMRYIAIVTLVFKLATVAALFLTVQGPDDFLWAAGIQSAGMMASGLAAFILAPAATRLGLRWPPMEAVKSVLREGRDVFFSTAAVSLYTNSNTFIVGLLTNPTEVGFFSAAEKLIRAVLNLLSPISQSVYPHISHMVLHAPAQAALFLSRLFWLFCSGSFLVSAVLFAGSGRIVGILFGQGFAPSAVIFRWMAFLPFVISISNVFGIQTLLTFGHHRIYSRNLIGAGILNVVLIVPLVVVWGGAGAAIAVLITEIAVAALMLISVRNCGIPLSRPFPGAR